MLIEATCYTCINVVTIVQKWNLSDKEPEKHSMERYSLNEVGNCILNCEQRKFEKLLTCSFANNENQTTLVRSLPKTLWWEVPTFSWVFRDIAGGEVGVALWCSQWLTPWLKLFILAQMPGMVRYFIFSIYNIRFLWTKCKHCDQQLDFLLTKY